MKNQKTILVAVFTMVFSLGALSVKANVLFDDGDVHDINWALHESVIIRDDAFFGGSTIVNLLPGGIVCSFSVWDTSIVNISGGNVYYSNSLSASDNSQVTVNNGLVEGTLSSDGNAAVIVLGGTINGDFRAFGHSQATVFGGAFGQTFYIGNSSSMLVDTSIMEFVGTDFAINGTPVGYGEFTNGGTGEIHGTLTGTLANGDLIDNGFWIYDNSKLVLTPEPASLVLLSLGGLAMIGRGRNKLATRRT